MLILNLINNFYRYLIIKSDNNLLSSQKYVEGDNLITVCKGISMKGISMISCFVKYA